MSTYEVEHNIASTAKSSSSRRPDLSTFFSNLELVDTSHTRNAHAVPIPADVSAVFGNLADAFERMRQDNDGGDSGLLESLVEILRGDAEMPPREVKGVSDEFLAELHRVPKKSLKKEDTCPICNNPFLEDRYPLVVRLPCHKDHIFDLECISPWLKLHPTCPLDRKDLVKKKEPPPKPPVEEEEDGEWDDMYA
ncbi:MAG: hypothetical protein MMC33_001020 [Icmadophila ericetorum]|nr:hypothetical protein [Icmadophila ericetorum]